MTRRRHGGGNKSEREAWSGPYIAACVCVCIQRPAVAFDLLVLPSLVNAPFCVCVYRRGCACAWCVCDGLVAGLSIGRSASAVSAAHATATPNGTTRQPRTDPAPPPLWLHWVWGLSARRCALRLSDADGKPTLHAHAQTDRSVALAERKLFIVVRSKTKIKVLDRSPLLK